MHREDNQKVVIFYPYADKFELNFAQLMMVADKEFRGTSSINDFVIAPGYMCLELSLRIPKKVTIE